MPHEVPKPLHPGHILQLPATLAARHELCPRIHAGILASCLPSLLSGSECRVLPATGVLLLHSIVLQHMSSPCRPPDPHEVFVKAAMSPPKHSPRVNMMSRPDMLPAAARETQPRLSEHLLLPQCDLRGRQFSCAMSVTWGHGHIRHITQPKDLYWSTSSW